MIRSIAAGAFVLMMGGCGGDAGPATDDTAQVNGQEAAAPPSGDPTSPVVRPQQQAFRDWLAVCDNGLKCAAMGGTGSGGWIKVTMDAGPQAGPSVSVGFWPDTGEPLSGPITLTLDGRRFMAAAGPAGTSSGTVASGDVAQAVIEGLVAARSLTLSAGGQTTALTLNGSSAALLWIDERQGRLGTQTALVRRGERLASAVPAAPALPVVVAARAVSQAGFTGPLNPLNDDAPSPALPAALQATAAVRECQANLAFNPDLQKAVTASRLDAATELWGVPCDSGAYNFSYAYFLTGANGANPRRAVFPGADGRPIQGPEGIDDWLVNPTYDPSTRELSAFAKARGLGDCGVAQDWVWTGRAFALKREAVMGECWGMISDLWPTTYRSR